MDILNSTVARCAVSVICTLAPFGTVLAQEGPPPAQVEVVSVERMEIAPQIEVPGTVISRNDSRIAAEVVGRLSWIADVGTELEEGGVIAKIDDRDLILQLQNAEANAKRLEASLNYQRKEVKRLRELRKSNNIPASRFEEALSRRDATEQELAQANIGAQRIAYDLERTEVKAPFPGRVVERMSQIGEYVSVGRPVARFVDTINIEIRAQIPVAVAPFLESGTSVGVTKLDVFETSQVRVIIPVGDEISRTLEIRVAVPNPDWIVGSAVRVSVPKSVPNQVIAVPRDALILRSDGIAIFKVSDESKAERVIVETGAAQGDYIEVHGLVSAGDRVIIRGAERLQPGSDVIVNGDSEA